MLRKTIVFILCLQLVGFPTVRAHEKNENSSQEYSRESQKNQGPSASDLATVLQNPEELLLQKQWSEMGAQLQAGTAFQRPEDFDRYRLTLQRVEIYDENGHVLGQKEMHEYQVMAEAPYYTSLHVDYSPLTKELILIATVGENEQGKNGRVVAKQMIGGLDLVRSYRDQDMIALVDRSGSVHVIDMSYVAQQIFRSPIPVFTNAFVPSVKKQLERQQVQGGFQTPGSTPYDLKYLSVDTPLQKNALGQEIYQTGSLAIMIQSPQAPELFIIPRQRLHEHIAIESDILLVQIGLLYPNTENLEYALEKISTLEETQKKWEMDLFENGKNPLVRSVLQNFNQISTGYLKENIQRHQNYKKRDYHQMTTSEHLELYQEALIAAGDTVPLKKVASNWKEYISKLQAKEPILKEKPSTTSRLIEKMKRIPSSIRWASVTIGAVAYLTFPAFQQAYLKDKEILFVNWTLDHLYPEVLKNKIYGIPTMKSILYLTALWPMSILLSKLTGLSIQKLATKYQNSSSPFAMKMRDLAKHWVDVTPWQRINNLGARIWSYFIYTPWRLTIELALRQHSFLTAKREGLSAFQSYSPESALGKKLGLEEKEYVGLNNPFLFGDRLKKKRNFKEVIQSALVDQKRRKEALAMHLAFLILSERSNVDPATLYFAAEHSSHGTLDFATMRKVSSDPNLYREWVVLRDGLIAEMSKQQEFAITSDSIDQSLVQEYYEKGKVLLQEILKQDSLKQELVFLKTEFDQKSQEVARDLIFFGKENSDFLKQVFLNTSVSEQVEKQFKMNYGPSVWLYGLYGKRADTNFPSELSAKPGNFLETNSKHGVEIVMSLLSNFFISGSNLAIVLQSIQPQEEKNYVPVQDHRLLFNERSEPFISGVKSWIRDVSNPLVADLGGFEMRQLHRRITTFWASLYMTVLARCTIMDYGVADSLLAWGFYMIAGNVMFGHLWTPVQKGNRLEEERFEKNRMDLKNLVLKLDQGIKDPDNQVAKEYLKGVSSEVIQLYQKNRPDFLGYLNQKLPLKSQEKVQVEFSDQEARYYGLVAGLIHALNEKDEVKIKKFQQGLRWVIAKDENIDITDLERLNAEGLLQLTLSDPPVYTQKNGLVSWGTTFFIGVLGSTILSIPFSVIIGNSETLHDWSLFEKWFFIAGGFYAGYYSILGSKSWGRILNMLGPHAWRSYASNLVDYGSMLSMNVELGIAQMTGAIGSAAALQAVKDRSYFGKLLLSSQEKLRLLKPNSVLGTLMFPSKTKGAIESSLRCDQIFPSK